MIRIGPAGAPRWFDQRLDRLDEYLDHIAVHGASCVEFVVHGGSPGDEAERVHLPERNWIAAVDAAQSRGLDVHLHAPLTLDYRLSNWGTNRAELADRYVPIIDLLTRIERGQDRPPVVVLHGATSPDNDLSDGERLTREFITWLLEKIREQASGASIAIELRLRAEETDNRFDRRFSSLNEFVAGFGTRQVSMCWDIANFLGSGDDTSELSPRTLVHINHVHLHDAHPDGRGFHAPLGAERLRWPQMVEQLKDSGWSGAITLEIRYRYAIEQGEPWRVLAESFERVNRVLTKE